MCWSVGVVVGKELFGTLTETTTWLGKDDQGVCFDGVTDGV